MPRRSHLIIRLIAALLCLALHAGCSRGDGEGRPRVLVIGIDGMDPVILRRLMDAGKMPAFQRLAETGGFTELATSMPPQSPVAWSNVIACGHPGVHEIYDFIHRYPKTYTPYLSTSTTDTVGGGGILGLKEISIGKWRLPLVSQKTILRRQGPAFWEPLVQEGVNTVIYRIPANYPVRDAAGRARFHCLAGMGTPDLLGTYGMFTVFTSDAPFMGRKVGGGQFVNMIPIHHRAKAKLKGPANPLKNPDRRGRVPDLDIEFQIVRDPVAKVAKIEIGGNKILLNEGEWSPWIQFDFETQIPGSNLFGVDVLGAIQIPTTVPGMVRVYLKQVHPELELFVTPINIDPTNPATSISVPKSFSADLADDTGLYFTAGIPEHPPEIKEGALNGDEWLGKARMILDKRIEQFHHALKDFDSGLLFYYFATTDLVSHIFWRDQDPDHPGRNPDHGDRYANVIDETYVQMDAVVQDALDAIGPEDTLIVMSDHGFTSFRWQFNLNTWLLQNGYIQLINPRRPVVKEFFTNVDWTRTRAYGIGFNSVYLNLRGREGEGIVEPGEDAERLIREISEKLLDVEDTEGTRVIHRNYIVSEAYPDADPQIAPDLLVGYAKNFRAGWATVLGGIPKDLIEANTNRWSGDHLIAADLVPGILVCNRKIQVDDANLIDIGPTIMNLFSIAPPADIGGRAILAADRPKGKNHVLIEGQDQDRQRPLRSSGRGGPARRLRDG